MRNRYSSRGRRVLLGLVAAVMALGTAACNLQDFVDAKLPPTSIDPEYFRTEDGALALYRGAIWAFRRGFGGANGSMIVATARLSDETTTGAYPTGTALEGTLTRGDNLNDIESRSMEEDGVRRSSYVESWYRDLNMARNQALDGIYFLKNYATLVPRDLIGHLYAIRGYTMVYLAEVFCSGIPLSDYLVPSGIIYRPGSPTEEVYERAIAAFDTALTFISDSANYEYLARVGKARALANLGRLDEAAAVVKDVPTDFVYQALYAEDYNGSFSNNWVWGLRDNSDPESNFGTVADRKGGNGLPYVSANDPRVPLRRAPRQSTTYPNTVYMIPAKWIPQGAPWYGLGTRPNKNGNYITVASGIEARLFEAEALAAKNDPNYLNILNELRTNGVSEVRDDTIIDWTKSPADTTIVPNATVWQAGTGGVAKLAPLTDPGNQKDRIKQVFDERAYWTFLTAQRQGAMRRMVRVHGFSQDEVYPTGYFYWGGEYGEYTNLPIPESEYRINPEFKGCIDRNP